MSQKIMKITSHGQVANTISKVKSQIFYEMILISLMPRCDNMMAFMKRYRILIAY